jgi:hypothetical protein
MKPLAPPRSPSLWPHHPNLRRRPHAPNKGRGRLQRQIRRAFIVHGPVVSSSQVYDWCFAHKRKLSQLRRHGVWRILREVADPVGRASTIGRPVLWRLGSELGSNKPSAADKPLSGKEK